MGSNSAQHGGCCDSGSASGPALVRHFIGRSRGRGARSGRSGGVEEMLPGSRGFSEGRRVFSSNVRRPSCRNYSKSRALSDVMNSTTLKYRE